jgi:hypothetical protein
MLLQITEEGNFDLLNQEDTPTYHYTDGSSVLDLTFSSPQNTPLISNCAIDEDRNARPPHTMLEWPSEPYPTAARRMIWFINV